MLYINIVLIWGFVITLSIFVMIYSVHIGSQLFSLIQSKSHESDQKDIEEIDPIDVVLKNLKIRIYAEQVHSILVTFTVNISEETKFLESFLENNNNNTDQQNLTYILDKYYDDQKRISDDTFDLDDADFAGKVNDIVANLNQLPTASTDMKLIERILYFAISEYIVGDHVKQMQSDNITFRGCCKIYKSIKDEDKLKIKKKYDESDESEKQWSDLFKIISEFQSKILHFRTTHPRDKYIAESSRKFALLMRNWTKFQIDYCMAENLNSFLDQMDYYNAIEDMQ